MKLLSPLNVAPPFGLTPITFLIAAILLSRSDAGAIDLSASFALAAFLSNTPAASGSLSASEAEESPLSSTPAPSVKVSGE